MAKPPLYQLDPKLRGIVESIHESPYMAVVIVSGGGALSLSWLLCVPGASRTILDMRVPYATSAMRQILKYSPDQLVSVTTAENMARIAYQKAKKIIPIDVPLVGISATATLVSDHPKKGEHRFFISSWTDAGVTTYGMNFLKGLRDRVGEDGIVSRMVINALAEACHLDFELPLQLDPSERLSVNHRQHEDPIGQLIDGKINSVTIRPDGSKIFGEHTETVLLAGSFDPFHDGHAKLAQIASEVIGSEVVFELSIVNVDKPPLTRLEINRRVMQFSNVGTLVLTRAPTFREKAEMFEGSTFVIGWDTAVRLVDSKYYGNDEDKMSRALGSIKELGCRFLVAGREQGNVFHTLKDVIVPRELDGIMSAIPEQIFRCDLSSTKIRSENHQEEDMRG